MRLPDSTRSIAFCALVAWAVPTAALGAPTTAPASVGALAAMQAPSALSGDGRWRFDVDAGNVLHRVRIDRSVPVASAALPLSVTTLAATGDGRRVALVSGAGCVAIVDFTAASPVAVEVRWLAVQQLPFATVAWSAAPSSRCERGVDEQAQAAQRPYDGFGLRVAALSADGRLLAIRAGVVDLDTGRVVARLPASIAVGQNPLLLGLRFLDGDRRLLALAVPLSGDQRSPSYAAEGSLVAVWDLPSGDLRRLVHLPSSDAAGRALLFSLSTPEEAPGEPGRADGTGAPQRAVSMKLSSPTCGSVETAPGRLLADDVVAWPIPMAGAPAATGRLSGLAQPCGELAEAAGAPRLVASDRVLRPLWRRATASVLLGRRAAFPDEHAWACEEWWPGGDAFMRRDRTLWQDGFASIVQVDLATGRSLRSLPVARQRDVCALAVPAAEGFFTYQADSLTLRRFEPAPGTEADAPRVLDVRPGWHVTVATVRGDRVIAQWESTPDRSAPSPSATAGARVKPVHVVAYDASTGRQLSDAAEDDPVDRFEGLAVTRHRFGADEADATEAIDAICANRPDPRGTAWTLRMDDLASFRGDECAAGPGQARTAFWSGLDLEASVPTSLSWSQFRRKVLAVDGSVGVVQDGQQLRVFDLAGRRELGRIALSDVYAVNSVRVLATQGVVLVEARDAEQDGKRQVTLSAYSLAPDAQ